MDNKRGIAVVTGGAQGIGRAICEALLKKGCKVCCTDVKYEEGNETVKHLQGIYGKESCIFLKCDVSSKEEFEETYLKATETLGKVHVLINNAGVSIEDKAIDINLNGTINGCNIAYKYMGRHNGGGGGIVVNIASITGLTGFPFLPTYSASKAGVIGLTRSLGTDLHYKRSKIKFTTLCPNAVNTDMSRNVSDQMVMKETFLKCTEYSQLIEPEIAAEAVMQLLEDGRNGAVMVVTAGRKNNYVSLPELEMLL